jgi:hypothetical protein
LRAFVGSIGAFVALAGIRLVVGRRGQLPK